MEYELYHRCARLNRNVCQKASVLSDNLDSSCTTIPLPCTMWRSCSRKSRQLNGGPGQHTVPVGGDERREDDK